MSKWTPKVGDRVAVYTGGNRYVAEIADMLNDGTLRFERVGAIGSFYAHPKQCRRLIRRERRRVYIQENPATKELGFGWVDGRPGQGWVEFVEVRRK